MENQCVNYIDLPVFNVVFTLCLQASPHISDEDYNDLLTTLCLYRITRSMSAEDVYEKVLVLLNFSTIILEERWTHNILCFLGKESNVSVSRISRNLSKFSASSP